MAKKKPKTEKTKPVGLKAVLSDIWKDYGDGAILLGQTIVNIESISTGAATLDLALGIGGIPQGRITEIYGPESSGKTTLCLEIIASAQRDGLTTAFIDVEHSLDLAYASNGPGVDVNKLLFSQPDSGEQALTIAERLAASKEVGLIVVDSVAALVPQAELDGELGDSLPGAQARLMSKSMRILKGILNKTNTAIIFTNQIREKIGVFFGNPEVTPGGRALKFYASVRIEIRRVEATRRGTSEDPTGNRVRTKIVKSKVAPPSRKAEFEIEFGKGIRKVASMVDVAEILGAITRSGSHYKYADKSYNGKERLISAFEDDPAALEGLNKLMRAQFDKKDRPEPADEPADEPEEQKVGDEAGD